MKNPELEEVEDDGLYTDEELREIAKTILEEDADMYSLEEIILCK